MQTPGLLEAVLDPDPIVQFRQWFADAQSAMIPQADAMTLATATNDGVPSARMVLLKGVDERGFRFFTNYLSRKGRELEKNPRAALVFFWEALGRQVRIEGTVSQLSPGESDLYFGSRPVDHQLSSVVSPQSEPVVREQLDARFDELRTMYEGRPIPRPGYWGGYCVAPQKIEFWQRRFARLNDRVMYTRIQEGGWSMQRLAP